MAYRRMCAAEESKGQAWWTVWFVAGAMIAATTPSWGQGTVPEVVRPPSGAATIPPGNDGAAGHAPRTDNPQVGGGGLRPVPDTGVIAPPVTGGGAVIRPPATGAMPVIPPPGSTGGSPRVVPK